MNGMPFYSDDSFFLTTSPFLLKIGISIEAENDSAFYALTQIAMT